MKLLLITSYIGLIIYNAITIMIHPDLPISTLNIIVSIVFVIILAIHSYKLVIANKTRILSNLILFTILAGIIANTVDRFDASGILYGISSIYNIIFIGPFYGLNGFVNLPYMIFSSLVSIILGVYLIFIQVVKFNKNRVKTEGDI